MLCADFYFSRVGGRDVQMNIERIFSIFSDTKLQRIIQIIMYGNSWHQIALSICKVISFHFDKTQDSC